MIPILLYTIKISGGYLAGTEVDWLSQHIAFPEYFRQRFYETGNLFPDFAMELGAGQNIYHFAYYGFCSPLYLLSFLLPSVSMADYMQGMMLVLWIADGLLCYRWLTSGHFGEEESFFASCIFVTAGPLVYHMSAQVMFVSYFPFLFLMLIGYDRYEKTGRYGLLTAGMCLMVLTSFYYAVGGAAVLVVYGLCGWKKEWASSVRVWIRSVWRQFYPALLGGLLSFFYLVPTVCAMFSGRKESRGTDLAALFVPEADIEKVLYNPYGLGLTAMAAVVILTGIFYRPCREKYLSAVLTVLLAFPVFEWVLNGGLYLRAKAFIPFLALAAYLFAAFFRYFRRGILARKKVAAGFSLAAVIFLWASMKAGVPVEEQYLLYADLAVCFLLIAGGWIFSRRAVCVGSALVMFTAAAVQTVVVKKEGGLIDRAWMQAFQSEEVEEAVKQVLPKPGESLYRVETRGTRRADKASDNQVLSAGQNLTTCYSSVQSESYRLFRDEEMHLSRPARNRLMQEASDNPVFLSMMGVRYLVFREGNMSRIPEGYEKAGEAGKVQIYENKEALPVAYVTDRVISERDWEILTWEERVLAWTGYAQAGQEDREGNQSAGERYGVQVREATGFEQLEGNYAVPEGKVHKSVFHAEDRNEDSYLFLSFRVKNHRKTEDVTIEVNGEKNKQSATQGYLYSNENDTFYYVCPLGNPDSTVEILLGAGDYTIDHVKARYGSLRDSEEELCQGEAPLVLSSDGDALEGKFESEKGGWLITSIPYDDGFQIRIDDQEVPLEKVNQGFVGAAVEKGEHKIQILYRAKGRKEGGAVTAATALALAADLARRRRGRKCKVRKEA